MALIRGLGHAGLVWGGMGHARVGLGRSGLAGASAGRVGSADTRAGGACMLVLWGVHVRGIRRLGVQPGRMLTRCSVLLCVVRLRRPDDAGGRL